LGTQRAVPATDQAGLVLTADPNVTQTVNPFTYVQYYDATTNTTTTASSILAPDELISVSSSSSAFRLKLSPVSSYPYCVSAVATITFWQVDVDGMLLPQATPKHPFVTPDIEWVGDPATGKTSVTLAITTQDADGKSIYYDFGWATLQQSPHFQYQIQATITWNNTSTTKTYITDPEMDTSTDP
jgi:hypothetical protein